MNELFDNQKSWRHWIWLSARLSAFPLLGMGIGFTTAVVSGDSRAILLFGIVFVVNAFAVGSGWLFGRKPVALDPRSTSLFVVMFWVAQVALGAVPFLAGGPANGLQNYANAFFEAMSGYTSTGLTMVIDPSKLAPSLQIYRSLLQWIGGAGFILFAALIIDQSESLQPLISASGISRTKTKRSYSLARVYLPAYLALTAVCFAGFFLGGMPGWAAVNHALTVASTGGFTITSDSFASYSPQILVFTGICLVAAALPLPLLYQVTAGRWLRVYRNEQVRLYIGWLGLAVVGFFLWMEQPARFLFDLTSAATTAGFSAHTELSAFGSLAVEHLILLMLVGGCAASTAGGVKIFRLYWVIKGIGRYGLHMFRGSSAERFENEGDTVKSLLTAAYFLVTLLCLRFAAVAIIGWLQPKMPTDALIFDVTSALTTTGLSLGAVAPDMHAGAKWIFSVLMLVGRLEFCTLVVAAVQIMAKGQR